MKYLVLASVMTLSACTLFGKTGGPLEGADDAHCEGKTPIVVSQDACHPTTPARHEEAVDSEYGETQYGSAGVDDECKYHLSFNVSAVRQDTDVTFTVQAKDLATAAWVEGANISVEAFLADTHPAPNSGQLTKEGAQGTYEIGPVRFDAPGTWTVRFHLFESCEDGLKASPHGHAAFYINVP